MDNLREKIEAMERSGLVGNLMKKEKFTKQKCMVCGRDTPILDTYTGEAHQRMCENCKKTYYDLAKIMCRKCGKFLGFMRTGVSETGYVVKRNETLHTPWCDNCDSVRAKSGSAPIEEIVRFADLKRQNELAGSVSADMSGKVNGTV